MLSYSVQGPGWGHPAEGEREREEILVLKTYPEGLEIQFDGSALTYQV